MELLEAYLRSRFFNRVTEISPAIVWKLAQNIGCLNCFVDGDWCYKYRIKCGDDDTSCMLTMYRWFTHNKEEPEVTNEDVAFALEQTTVGLKSGKHVYKYNNRDKEIISLRKGSDS